MNGRDATSLWKHVEKALQERQENALPLIAELRSTIGDDADAATPVALAAFSASARTSGDVRHELVALAGQLAPLVDLELYEEEAWEYLEQALEVGARPPFQQWLEFFAISRDDEVATTSLNNILFQKDSAESACDFIAQHNIPFGQFVDFLTNCVYYDERPVPDQARKDVSIVRWYVESGLVQSREEVRKVLELVIYLLSYAGDGDRAWVLEKFVPMCGETPPRDARVNIETLSVDFPEAAARLADYYRIEL